VYTLLHSWFFAGDSRQVSSLEVTLLPVARFPRIALAAAALVVLLLFLTLGVVHSPAKSLLFSNTLDFAIVFLAALASFYAAWHSSGYARQLWLLLAIALTMDTLAQSISTYYQSFVPGSAQIPWPSDVLFFLWTAPIFMMFLPGPDEKFPGWDWLRTLDFAQIAIVAATAYLYFFYVPSRWQANGASLVRELLILYIVRDILLGAGFVFRSRTSISPNLRTFFFGMALVFLADIFSEGDYFLTLKNFAGAATWGDLLWTVPYLAVVILASTRDFTRRDSLVSPPSRFGNLAVTHVLPVAIPLLVIFMGRRIAKEQVVIAWLAVTTSFLCAALRLILTNRRQRAISEELLGTEKALHRSEHMFASAFRSSPDSFSINVFPDGPYLDVNEGFTRLTGYSREEAIHKTPLQLNLWVAPSRRSQLLSQLSRDGEIRDADFLFRTKSGQIRTGLFSGALLDLDGRRCALLVVRDITERRAAEDAIRESEERFRTLVRDLHVGVVLHGPDAKIQFANRAALTMFGFADRDYSGHRLVDFGLSAVDEAGRDVPYENLPVPSVLRTKLPVRDGTFGWRRPGIPEILWIFGNSIPQFAPDGSILRVISSFADITEMKNAERAIHQLSTHLLSLQDEERRRIGRELHDGMAQTVLAVNLSLAQVRQSQPSFTEPAARALDKARELLQQMSREIRTLSYLLHPPLLDDLGLVSALKEYVTGFSERSGIQTTFDLQSPFRRFSQPVETALFRIVQESLANIQRHSGSTRAMVALREDASAISLEITDYGRGMIVRKNGDSKPGRAQLGVGIPGMRERMAQLGGQLDIQSSASGTIVRATILLSAAVLRESHDEAPSHPHRG
jgi:PAS domain S-box-containing protein